MNSIQAIIILKNGKRKYGAILEDKNTDYVRFLPSLRTGPSDYPVQIIETILMKDIYSIDTYLK
jgi:hypothetical protein